MATMAKAPRLHSLARRGEQFEGSFYWRNSLVATQARVRARGSCSHLRRSRPVVRSAGTGTGTAELAPFTLRRR